MKRNTWKFKFDSNDVLSAAANKLVYHQGRLDWWKAQRDAKKRQIQTEGLVIDESLSNTVSNSYSRGSGVSIDSTMANDLNESVGKIREHQNLVDQYRAWVRVLEAQDNQKLSLNHDDWLFFFSEYEEKTDE